ncbi:hypothetical protein CLU79DRAFT_758460 [Phycomyces nitens]|nr:hypothetical protein CLU79DRAFT_758460 [Phycomyces nitens]
MRLPFAPMGPLTPPPNDMPPPIRSNGKRRSSDPQSKFVQTDYSVPHKMRVVSGENLATVAIPAQWTSHASTVVHDPKSCMFKMVLDNHGSIAALCYLPTRFQAIVEFYHTEIPIAYRNMGIGDRMAQEAFLWLEQSNRLMIPTCPFVLRYLERHFQDRNGGSWAHVVRSEQEGMEKLMKGYACANVE